MLSEQTFLNAGPLIVNATSGAAAAGFIFNILMIARAPLQLFQAVSTSLSPPHPASLGQDEDFRDSVRVTIRAIAAFAGLVGLAMLIAGPDADRFRRQVRLRARRSPYCHCRHGPHLAGATLNQAALAQGQVRRASACWIGCAIAFVLWTALPIIADEFTRVEVGFGRGHRPLRAALLDGQPHLRVADRPTPGSGEEVELQLAAADEGSP